MRFIRAVFYLGIICAILVAGLVIYYSNVINLQSYEFKKFAPDLTTQIYDRNNKLIANIFVQDRFYAKYEDFPPRLIEALVAIEDTSFFEHHGINIDAIFRAGIKVLRAGKAVEGASTLTQQLVKNTELSPKKTLKRKIKEALLSLKIETVLSKEEILERYLNYIFFGHGYYGVRTAALGYFHKDLKQLNLKEIAMLVGMPRAPSSYNPTKHLSLSLSRANQVIKRMYDLGWISKEEYQVSIKEVPKVYNDSLSQNKAPYVTQEVLKRLANIKDLRTGGYKIYTSIDLDVQEAARKALRYGYDKIILRDKKANLSQLNGAFVVLNHQSGDILALVGGIDYEQSKFNRATQSKRQLGSAFKPFVYQIAINMGLSPMSEVADISRVFISTDKEVKDWRPKNYANKFEGLITLKRALTRSRNLATINLALDLGPDILYQKIAAMGFKGVPKDLSVVLGSFGMSPLELAKFYTMFGNYGVIKKPILIKQIQDKQGKIIFASSQEERQVSRPCQAFLINDMLRSVVSNGTGRKARVKGIQIAGKTGTSNRDVDAWFAGITPEIEALIWYGNDDNTPMREGEGGGRTAAPAFADFMKNYLLLFPDTKRTFTIPPEVYKGIYKNKVEFYTPFSPFPKQGVKYLQNNELLIF